MATYIVSIKPHASGQQHASDTLAGTLQVVAAL